MKRILSIEDHPDIVVLVRYELGEAGFHVIEAPDGLSGRAAHKQTDVDLPLLDTKLPGNHVTCPGKIVPTSLLEFRLLYHPASHPRHIFTREEPLSTVWAASISSRLALLDVCVRRQREKTEIDPGNPRFLNPVRRSGYLFESIASDFDGTLHSPPG